MAKASSLLGAKTKAKRTEEQVDMPLEANQPNPVSKNADTKALTLRLNKAAWQQLKILSLESERTGHDLLIEAVNDLLQKNGKPPVA